MSNRCIWPCVGEQSFIDGDLHIKIKLMRTISGGGKTSIIEMWNLRTKEITSFESRILDEIISKLNQIITSGTKQSNSGGDNNEGSESGDGVDEVDLATNANRRKPMVQCILDDHLYRITYLWNSMLLIKSDIPALCKAQKIKNIWEFGGGNCDVKTKIK